MINSGKVFLLVDDDEDDRALFEEALSVVGKDVTFYQATNGKEALTMLADFETLPNVIFLDINMPVMTGWECLTQLKSIERYKEIPVIIYSTSSNPRDIQISKELGALCFCVKPDEFKKLVGILQMFADNDDSGVMPAIKQFDKDNPCHFHIY